MNVPETRSPIYDKAIRLFTYLQELVQLRTPPVRDVESYESVIWFSEIPHEESCYSISWGVPVDDGDVWLEIKKRKEPSFPGPPVSCKDWIDATTLRKSDSDPRLMDRIFVPSTEDHVQLDHAPVGDESNGRWVLLGDHPDVQSDWEEYQKAKWRPWADQHQRWKIVQTIYGRLFSIYQLQRGLAETYEFVIGLGVLTWETPSGQHVRRHILAGQASLEFDSNTGTLAVRPAADGVKLGFEMEMLEPSERPIAEQIVALESALSPTSEAPWDRTCIEPILRGWVHSLDSEGTYDAADERPTSFDRQPRLTFAPAVFLRRRTVRSLVGAFRAVIEQLKHGEEIPFGIMKLLEITNGPNAWQIEGMEEGLRIDEAEAGTVYFPLPANEEQRQIVERMARDQGVLVQGPPGTGKSHTISNLICHLLAKGKRILVTSQTPRALKVLQGKIPKELLPLCVSLLGNDRESLRGLEDSVHGITNRYQGWDSKANDIEIQRLQIAIFEHHKRRAVIDSRLRELRERDTFEFVVAMGAYRGTAAAIARRISELAPLHDWMPDEIIPESQLPLATAEIFQLLEAHRTLDLARSEELKKKFPSLGEVPSLSEFLRLAESEEVAATNLSRYENARGHELYTRVLAESADDRDRAVRCLRDLLTALEAFLRRPVSWLPFALKSLLTGQDRTLRELREFSSKNLQGLSERAQRSHLASVEVSASIDRRKLRADATDLREHLKGGGSLGWGPFRKEVVKQALYVTTEVRVNGRACKTPEVLDELLLRLEVEVTVSRLWDAWRGFADRTAGPLPRQVIQLEEQKTLLDDVFALEGKLFDARKAVRALGDFAEPKWHEFSQINRLISVLDATLAETELLKYTEAIQEHFRTLTLCAAHPKAHPVVTKGINALQARDSKEWGNVVHEIETLTQHVELQTWRLAREAELARSAPKFARLLRDSANEPVWEHRLARIEEAWHWAQADAWLREYEAEHDVRSLDIERQQIEKLLSDETAALAAAKAWRFCFARMTEENRSYLQAWRKEIKSIGKGTGKYAETHRRTAQKYMNKCREAIPAWIMPFYRVVETIQPRKHCFDVVIVDEASQSGPEALLLQYLAKQIVIVGDDQQISPEDVGVDQSQVYSLQQRYLPDFGLKETFGTGYSLFAQAEIRYGNRIPLREHFRCMPEIIRFSNDLCYLANPLVPLRQYPPKRLEPILVRHVPTGFREGGAQSARNVPEAQALVDAICECCSKPEYERKTIGVISLQGDYQAGLIQRLLKDKLGEQEMARREIICGDAYAFQGDERDVIFMSMVAAPNERIGALTKETDKRRFNVAASRPRDQVWLFHTATLNDLNQEDLRFKLLSYYLNPGQSALGAPDWARCESQFESDVGRQIVAHGYRLVLQFEPFGTGGKRIDLMVEGESARLAVECDGDRWHGPDEYDKDMFRQRQLERAGLVFWRIRGSEYYRNTEASLRPLWRRLAEMGIEPWDRSQKAVIPDEIKFNETADSGIARPVQSLLVDKPTHVNLFIRGEVVTTSIDEVPRERVREVLHSFVPDEGSVPREDLLHEVARNLGYSKLGRNIRSTINRTIGAEVRAGRLKTDWQKVWRTERTV